MRSPPSTAGGYAGWEVVPFPSRFPMLAPLENGRTPGAPLNASHRWRAALRLETALAAAPNRAFEALDAAARAEYDRVSGACFRRLEVDRVDLNTLVDDELLRQLFDVLETAENHPSVAKPARVYTGCLARHGFEVSERQQLIDHVTAQFSDPVSAAPVAAGNERATEASLVQERAVRADAECRADAHSAAIAVVAPLITEFAVEHAAELERAAQRWEDAASA